MARRTRTGSGVFKAGRRYFPRVQYVRGTQNDTGWSTNTITNYNKIVNLPTTPSTTLGAIAGKNDDNLSMSTWMSKPVFDATVVHKIVVVLWCTTIDSTLVVSVFINNVESATQSVTATGQYTTLTFYGQWDFKFFNRNVFATPGNAAHFQVKMLVGSQAGDTKVANLYCELYTL